MYEGPERVVWRTLPFSYPPFKTAQLKPEIQISKFHLIKVSDLLQGHFTLIFLSLHLISIRSSDRGKTYTSFKKVIASELKNQTKGFIPYCSPQSYLNPTSLDVVGFLETLFLVSIKIIDHSNTVRSDLRGIKEWEGSEFQAGFVVTFILHIGAQEMDYPC